jgi:hypothetical protein
MSEHTVHVGQWQIDMNQSGDTYEIAVISGGNTPRPLCSPSPGECYLIDQQIDMWLESLGGPVSAQRWPQKYWGLRGDRLAARAVNNPGQVAIEYPEWAANPDAFPAKTWIL